MSTNEGIQIWQAVAIAGVGCLQTIGLGMLWYVIKRLDSITRDASQTKERVSKMEGHLEATDSNFRPAFTD